MPGGPKPKPVAVRLWARVGTTPDPFECWHWPGKRNRYGYGTIRAGGRDAGIMMAHVVAYESAFGEVPAGLHVDHTCHGADLDCPGGTTCLHRRCVNPGHLEAVTQAENNRRMQARKSHCPQHHPLSGDNLYTNPTSGHRECKTCKRASVTRWYQANRDEYNAARRNQRAI